MALFQILRDRLDHAAGKLRFDYKRIAQEELEEREEARRLSKGIQTTADISPLKGTGILRDTTHPEAAVWRDAFEFLFDTECLAESILDDAVLNDEHLEEIAAIYNMCFPGKGTSQAIEFHVAAIFVKRLLIAYRQVKTQFWENTAETIFPELDSLHRQIATISEERSQLRNENLSLREQGGQLHKLVYSEYSRAKAESKDTIQQLSAEVEELKAQADADRRELAALRTLFFHLSPDTTIVPIFSSTDPSPYLAKARGVRGLIAGGHERWQQRMKHLLPHFAFIHTDALNFDSSLFSNIDAVFVHSGYISHAFYNRVISSLRSYPQVSLHYLHDTNPMRTLKDIAAAIDGETF